jgi:sporulation protein YlmC with PRC-barrel domain
MRLKELRGLPVIDPTAARKIGTVIDYQVDPASGRLAALDISAIGADEQERILAPRIRRVGRSAIILTARGGASPNAPIEPNERWLDSSTLVGLEVMGDDGNRIGHLLDATFDQDSLDIEAYALRVGLWELLLARGGRIAPSKVHSCSRDLMMVATGRLKEQPMAVEMAAAETSTPQLSTSVPLKAEDRLAAPTYEQVPDGQPVGARSD